MYQLKFHGEIRVYKLRYNNKMWIFLKKMVVENW